MSVLPHGYAELHYIQSSGTQYIDTGFVPNQNTRIVLDAYNDSTSSGWTYGVWTSSTSNQFAGSCNAAYAVRYDTTSAKLSENVPVGKVHFDQNKNAYTVNGTSGTFTAQTFTCAYSIYLFAMNAAGSASSGKFTGKLYSCQICDNDTLVRNYVPCMNPSGEVGLYDLVTKQFYGNAGTGTFTGKVKVIKAKPAFLTRRGEAPFAKRASDYAIGESVFLNINNSPVEFLVVHQGIPTGSVTYDSSCSGTWLLMKDIYEHRAWHSSSVNNYKNSSINTYLNGTFLGLFDTDVQNVIKQVKIPYGVYNANDSITATVYSGANGLSTKIFLPSGGECGHDHVGYDYQAYDGENLEYFVDTASDGDDPKRLAYYNGEVSRWWTRSCRGGSQGSAYYVDTTGRFSYESVTASHGGLRPMLIVPFETKFNRVDDTFLEA